MSTGSIKNWAEDDRPREKLLLKGTDALSNSELLGILIGNGTRSKSAVDLAKEVLQLSNNNLNELGKLTLKELQTIKGIGKAKAISISAALELGKRRQSADIIFKDRLTNSRQISDYLRVRLKDLKHEVFLVVYLNQGNRILHMEEISKGGIAGTVVDIRIILQKALELGATALVLSHNHPSGNLNPSKADEKLTEKITQAAALMDIKVLDHIIVSDEGYYSFSDEGRIA